MFPGDHEALIATGYLRAGSEHLVSGNIDPEESRQEVLTEIATNVGQTFLGMTVNCARCHNHKFDPILQRDFYALQSIFAGAKGKDVEIAAAGRKGRLGGRPARPTRSASRPSKPPSRRSPNPSTTSSAKNASASSTPNCAKPSTFPKTSAPRNRSASPPTPKRKSSRPGTKSSPSCRPPC